MEMAATTTFTNNGSATVTQEVTAQKTITETIEVEKVNSLSTMESVDISAKVEYVSKLNLELIGLESRIEYSVSTAYMKNSSSQSKDKYVDTETKDFSATQRIEIPPCTIYKVSSYIKMAENMPMDYTFTAYVSGYYGNDRLSAAKVKNRLELDGMTYVEDKDPFTVIANATQKITADFGLQAQISGEGVIIQGCKSMYTGNA